METDKPQDRVVGKRQRWLQFMEEQGWKVSDKEADRILSLGEIGAFFDYEDADLPDGFIDIHPGKDEILLVTDNASFLRNRKYLVTGEDGVFVTWIELLDLQTLAGEKRMPEFGDFFEIKEI